MRRITFERCVLIAWAIVSIACALAQ